MFIYCTLFWIPKEYTHFYLICLRGWFWLQVVVKLFLLPSFSFSETQGHIGCHCREGFEPFFRAMDFYDQRFLVLALLEIYIFRDFHEYMASGLYRHRFWISAKAVHYAERHQNNLNQYLIGKYFSTEQFIWLTPGGVFNLANIIGFEKEVHQVGNKLYYS